MQSDKNTTASSSGSPNLSEPSQEYIALCMDSDYKKSLLLLKYVIFNFHGLDAEEEMILVRTANEIGAENELTWVRDFASQDILTALDRATEWLNSMMATQNEEIRIELLKKVWSANNHKGYISEMEAMGMLKFARQWRVERQLIAFIKN